MKKEYWFVIVLLIGVMTIIGVLFSISAVVNIPAFTALYLSVITAVYTALSKPNPNESKRREIFGIFKKILIENIGRLERKDYGGIELSPWSDIKLDERHELVDLKLRRRLDALLDRIAKYNAAIEELDETILPKIVTDGITEVFQEGEIDLNAHYTNLVIEYTRKNEGYETRCELVSAFKKKLELSATIKRALKEDYETSVISKLSLELNFNRGGAHYEINKTDQEDILKFWSTCLQKIENDPKHKFVVEENENLLKESREILAELIKRLENTS